MNKAHARTICACLAFVLACASFAMIQAVALSCAFPQRAYAYVDPSVMTYTIQALAGVVVALSAVAGVAFRRTRKALFKALKIDENAHKEADPQWERTSPSEENLTRDAWAFAGADKDASRSGDAESARTHGVFAGRKRRSVWNPTWPQRFAIAFAVAFAFAFTVFIVPPIEVVGGNAASLTFTLGEIWWIPTLFGFVVAFVLALVLSALRGKAFCVGVIVCASVTVAAYVQALLLNMNMPVADGAALVWEDYDRDRIVSLVVWLAIIVLPLVLGRKRLDRLVKPFMAVMGLLVVVQLAGVVSVFANAGDDVDGGERVFVTADGFLELSPTGNNVVVFVVDTLDNAYVRNILAEDPDFLRPFEGFTYFENATGSMIPTCYGVPFLLSGQMPDYGEDFHAYIERRYASSSFLDDLTAADYSIGLYTDSVYEKYGTTPEEEAKIVGQTMNMHAIADVNIDVWGALGALEQLALYREAPWVAKPLFWFYTTDLNNRMVQVDDGTDLSNVQYILDDNRHLREVRERGLALVDDGKAGAFRFIHLSGAHTPYNLDAEGNLSTTETSAEEQTRGSMQMVFAYLDEMRRLGVYDDATIIVTTDHGHYEANDPLTDAAPIAVLVKPGNRVADDMGATDYPYARDLDWGVGVSDMPVWHGDVPATVIAAVGGDASAYGTTLFQVDDANRVRHYINTMPYDNFDHDFMEYEINGDANDFSNWHATGEMWSKRGW